MQTTDKSYQSTATSRREFLALVAAANGALLVGQRTLWAAEADPRVKEIVAKTITVDMHNHGPRPAAPNSAAQRTPQGARQRDTNVPDAMKRAGDSVVCLTYAVDGSLMGGGDPAPGTRSNLVRDPKPGEMYQVHLKNEDDYDALFASTPQLQRVLEFSDIETARKEGRAAIIQDAEGADFLEAGHLDRLQEAHKRGLRKLQLVHYAVNDITEITRSARPNTAG